MEKVLITGGGGFIGSHLAERLAPRFQVVLFDNFRRNALEFAPQLQQMPNVKVVRGDIRDRQLLEETLADVDHVFHLAAIAGVSSYYSEPVNTLTTNILGTVTLLECMVGKPPKTLVYFSTSEVYGAEAAFVNEQQPFRFGPVTDRRWTYATSKVAGENFCLRYGEQYDIRTAVVRPFNIYGPRQVGEGAISNFCSRAASGMPLTVYGAGTAIRSWCYIEDCIDAVESILDTKAFSGPVNIGNPGAVQNSIGLARMVASLVPDQKIDFRDIEHSEIGLRIPDITRASRELSFKPKVDLLEGLSRTLEWFREQEQKK